jgi:hypothetical protein
VLFEVGGAGAGHLLQAGDAARHHAGVAQFAHAQHAIDAVAHQIDQAVAHADFQFNAGIAGEEFLQRGST